MGKKIAGLLGAAPERNRRMTLVMVFVILAVWLGAYLFFSLLGP